MITKYFDNAKVSGSVILRYIINTVPGDTYKLYSNGVDITPSGMSANDSVNVSVPLYSVIQSDFTSSVPTRWPDMGVYCGPVVSFTFQTKVASLCYINTGPSSGSLTFTVLPTLDKAGGGQSYNVISFNRNMADGGCFN